MNRLAVLVIGALLAAPCLGQQPAVPKLPDRASLVPGWSDAAGNRLALFIDPIRENFYNPDSVKVIAAKILKAVAPNASGVVEILTVARDAAEALDMRIGTARVTHMVHIALLPRIGTTVRDKDWFTPGPVAVKV